MKLAAIDIGSNAIRLQVTNTTLSKKDGEVTFKKVEYIRFPLRLGRDVFTHGKISKTSKENFKKLMTAFKLLLDLYQVDDYMACATSAMREAENGQVLANEVKKEIGLNINIIDGDEEAALINYALKNHLVEGKTYLHIDVGGGSTELNVYDKGKKATARSFKIGSVRRLEHHDSPEIWDDMKKWVKENVKKEFGKATAIGTGGNINKIYDLAGKDPGKTMSIKKAKEIQTMLRDYSLEERMEILQLNPDRADVIIPASEIYISVMEWAKASSIVVPDVGLKDGVMRHLYERNANKIPVV